MRLVTTETVTLIVIGWVLVLGTMLVRRRRSEVGRRTVFNWALATCSSVGWTLWQFDTLSATADTPISVTTLWLAILLGLVGAAVAIHLYRTRLRAEARESEPTPEADETGTRQSQIGAGRPSGMHVLRIVGTGATALCDRPTAQLDGRVTTAESLPESATEPESTDGVAATYGLSSNGNWAGSDGDRSLDELLDDLSAKYDYAPLSGFPGAHVPTVVLAGIGAANVIVEAEAADAVDAASPAAEVNSHEPHVTLETLVERAKTDLLKVHTGAVATFTGRVRVKESEDDDLTLSPEFEKYDGVVESKMDAISEELEARDGVLRVLMRHRVNVVGDGADIVFAVALAGHRREAFRMVKNGINHLRGEVSIFKKRTTTDEEFWVHDR